MTGSFKIWVDADACPGAVREIVLKASRRLNVPTVFVANKGIYLPLSELLQFVQVAQGPDVVDQYIVAHSRPGDLAITQDIPLAADLVAQGVTAISPHGTLFTEASIGEKLSSRNFMQDLRDAGLVTGGPKPFGDKEKRQFSNTFDRVLTRLLKG